MSVIKNLLKRMSVLKSAASAAALLAFTLTSGAKETEELKDFALKSCNQDYCFHLKTESSVRGHFDQSYIFPEEVELKIYDVNSVKHTGELSSSLRALVGNSGYYDPQLGIIVLRRLKDQRLNETLIHLQTAEVEFFQERVVQ